ncbi:MAG: PAS domain-containing protein [Flavobacteriales bacterium]|nr:PAS domain-containing protein [Flavobacteriales bacterium]NQX98124.1 PAS domain-containing protein [Flavobacteriales bacterium]
MEIEVKQDLLNKRLFMNMVENNWLAVVFANMNNIVEYVNPAACRLYGYEEHELIGQTTDIFNSNLSHNTDEIVKDITERGYWFGEIIQRKKDDSTFDALLSVQLILNEEGAPIGFASNSKSISLELDSERRLKTTVEEKELLLKELHHRVKNNLAIIKGIISLQSNEDLDDNCIKIIDDFRNRIDAVATLHNTLYTPENFNNLNIKTFVNDLFSGLNKSYSPKGKKVNLINEMGDYNVKIDDATPLCLIINEVITNCFKHAFSLTDIGTINIKLCKEQNLISIIDNGCGFDYESSKKSSLGMSLIKDLSEQIDAKFKFKNNNGTHFTIFLNNE